MSGETLTTIAHFVSETPPGELQEVLNGKLELSIWDKLADFLDISDIRVLVNNNEDFVQEAIAQPLAEYSISSFLVIETDPATNSKIILTKHNQLEDGRFVDQKSATSFAVDHVTQTTSDPQPHDSPSHIEDHRCTPKLNILDTIDRKALELAIASYTEDHYPEGFSAVYSGEGKTLVACIVSNKFNPTNFWNGRWISEWTVSLDFDDVKGDVRAHVHYYEDGNVQLKASKQLSVKRSATEIDPTSFAASVVKVILKAETDYQMALNVTYSQISDTTFKSLRRALPITRTKFDWNSVSNYKIGAELSNK
ncbi:F-actin-capping protein [Physocladia obscura]|uniref:F-actin-capping protein subunit alpha n=1 Tax=Physocladia obscura TaxID=109957 RepID=A0AAD5T7M7_9FUNG|nr:F-actin-capping protein [Physocladia obscura]